MTCPQTCLVLRLVSGDLSPSEQRDFRSHLEGCATCAAAYAEMSETWNALNSWQPDVSGCDLTARVLASVEDERQPSAKPPGWAMFRMVPVRLAASIALAIGLGVVAGYLVPAGRTSANGGRPATLHGMAGALEWIELGAGSATGLSGGLEPEESVVGGEPS